MLDHLIMEYMFLLLKIKIKIKNVIFRNNSNHQFVLIHNEHGMENEVFQMKQVLNQMLKD